MNRLLPPMFLGLAALAVATRADAAISAPLAVCAVRFDPQVTYGSFGGVVLSLKSSYDQCPNPSIPLAGAAYFCSKQAANSNCTVTTAFHYSEPGIQGIYQAAIQAMVNERIVEIFSEATGVTRGQQLRVY
jgi:hypothetical protein